MTDLSQQREKICVHHVGGRAGSRAFPVMDTFEGDLINVLYEADADCIAQIKERNKRLASRLAVLPYCLAEANKSTELNINFDRYTSSVYEANPDYQDYYVSHDQCDYVLGQAIRVMEKRPVRTVTLDDIVQSAQVIPPDFLSIDTQGSEFDILNGSVRTLQDHVLAVVLEAEFHPLYKDQKLFGEICSWLSAQGFHFARFLDLQQASPYRAAVGLRGDGFHSACDALFLKRLEIVSSEGDASIRELQLQKLAFISIVFQQFEYGWAALARVTDQGPPIQKGFQYLNFLKKLQPVVRAMPQKFLASPNDQFRSFAESQAQFDVAADRKTAFGNFKTRLLKSAPFLFVVWRRVRAAGKTVLKQMRILTAGESPVEKIFCEYGLTTQAGLLRSKRLIHEQFLR